MRPEEFVLGLERSEHERGFLEEREEEFEKGDAKPYDEQVAENRISARSHHDDVLAVVQAIFEERTESMPVLDELELSVQEKSALQALQTAYTGRETRYNTFVYAEQRRELLEQALAALQPMLALDVSASAELRETYERMVEQVTELRENLLNLEDSQDDEVLMREALKKEEQESDDADQDDGDRDADAATGEKTGEKTSALFDGPAAPDKVAARSTLSEGPPLAEPAPEKSSLFDGPAVPDKLAPRSSLGDPSEGGGEGEGGGKSEAGGGKGGVLSRIGRALGIGKGEPDGGKGAG